MDTQYTLDTLGRYEDALAAFQRDYPTFDTDALDALRAQEYSRLDAQGHVYLDYTGGGLYAEHQIDTHLAMLRAGVFGNPHSSNPTSLAMTQLVERTRAYILDYFNADEYVVVFTQNASGALKLVGESYPFAPGGHYLLTFDNHNSVNGIREFARAKGADVVYAPVLPPELRIDENKMLEYLDLAQAQPGSYNLLAYPAQSNFSGVQHSLDWIARAQAKGWDVLLDVAAFVPTNRLDLSVYQPDFVALSFYKIFGYPTGVGCLLARHATLEKLRRPWFAGGTITIASVQGDGYYLEEGEAAFEDGTVDYLNLPAVEIGLKHITHLDIDAIHERVMTLTDWLIKHLLNLYHSNGQPVIHLYGPANTDRRGGTVTINFFDPQGKLIDYRTVEAEANKLNISLRTGCFCNPGAGEKAHGLTRDDLADCFQRDERMTFEEFIRVMHGRAIDAVGAVRISVGLATNFRDVYRFMQFAATFIDRTI